MDIRDRNGLKTSADNALSQASYSPKKLALIHAGAALALSLIITVLNFILNKQIDSTGGLSGIGLRSTLSTAQSVLSILNALILPFWEIGFVAAAIAFARHQTATPDTLLSGFRRFGPVLRLKLLQVALYAIVAFLCIQISAGLFIMTPFSNPLMAELEQLYASESAVLDEAALQTMSELIIPVYGIFAVLFCLLGIPLSYRFRMADFIIMDTEKVGALRAMGRSNQMMRYNRLSLFKLDLSFWWYYLLRVIITALGFGDMILTAMGFDVFQNDVAFFGFYILYLLCQLGLAWWMQSKIQTTYAFAYESLRPEAEDPEPPVVRSFPWDYLPK